MGGAGSEIRDDTTDVLLEAAVFDPAVVRYTSRKLLLFTDSSYRFERGVNAESVDWASQRAAQLMVELAGATVDRGVIDVRAPAAPPRSITLRFDRVRSLLGTEIAGDRIVALLGSLELCATERTEQGATFAIPSFRFDLEREVDLIEEIARLHGLDQIVPVPSAAAPNPAANDTPVRQVSELRNLLIHLGLQETITYSLVPDALLSLFDRNDAAARIALPRPVTADQAILRTHLAPQLVETLGRNRARQINQAAVFEIGTVYHRVEGETYRETRRFGIALMGRPATGGVLSRKAPSRDEMFGWIKGLWERIAAHHGITAWSIEPESVPYGEPGYGFRLLIDGQAAGRIALVTPAIRKEWRITDPVGLLEADVAPVAWRARTRPAYRPVPNVPSVARDVALVADAGLTHAAIVAAIRIFSPPELEHVELFDIFTGESLGKGRRSMAYSLTYRSDARTLTDEEVNGYHEAIKSALKTELKVEIREG